MKFLTHEASSHGFRVALTEQLRVQLRPEPLVRVSLNLPPP